MRKRFLDGQSVNLPSMNNDKLYILEEQIHDRRRQIVKTLNLIKLYFLHLGASLSTLESGNGTGLRHYQNVDVDKRQKMR